MNDEDIRNALYFSPNGQYLIVEDPLASVEALAKANVGKQKDYDSFARQMGIYGWKRLTVKEAREAILVDGEGAGNHLSTKGPRAKLMQHDLLVCQGCRDRDKQAS